MAKRNIFGLIYDSKTQKVTLDDGQEPLVGADFTFEDHEGYNPLQHATEETGQKILQALKKVVPPDVDLYLRRPPVEGPIAPPPQLQVFVVRWGISAEFNAGLIANSIIRSGSLNSVLAELKTAGILF